MSVYGLSLVELQVFADLVAQIADEGLRFPELHELGELSEDFGERFSPLMKAAREKNAAQALDGVGQVVRAEARELILTMLYDMAASDGLAEREERLLQALHEAWASSG